MKRHPAPLSAKSVGAGTIPPVTWMRRAAWAAALLLGCAVETAWGGGPVVADHVEAELVAEHEGVRPGTTVWVGLRFKLDPRWHLYWRNPGDSGMAPSVEWQLPEGVEAAPLQWPAPRRIPLEPLMMFGYEDELLLPVVLKIADTVEGDAVVLVAKTTWLVCEEVCISGEATLELRLPISSKAPRSDGRWGDLFARTRRLLPREPEAGALSAVWSGDKVILRLKNDSDVPAEFFPSDEGVLDNAAPQSATRSDGLLAVALTLSTENEPPASLQLRGVLVVGEGDSRTAFAVNVPVTSDSQSPSFILAAAVVVVVVAAVLILMLRRTRETSAGETG